uniref:Uncharacterized protein n=1 Tax=Rhizophora mucronata TaxID=61149 RepID=A0A2P2NF48_RHIMU
MISLAVAHLRKRRLLDLQSWKKELLMICLSYSLTFG